MTEPTTVEGQGEAPWTGWVLISDDPELVNAGRVGEVVEHCFYRRCGYAYLVRVAGSSDFIYWHDELSKWQVQA